MSKVTPPAEQRPETTLHVNGDGQKTSMTFDVQTVVRRYGNWFKRNIQVQFPASVGWDSWVVQLVQRLAERSAFQPLMNHRVDGLRTAVNLLFGGVQVPAAVMCQEHEMSREMLQKAFAILEDRLAASGLKEPACAVVSWQFRQNSARFFQASERSPIQLQRLFRTRFRARTAPRRLISDSIVNGRPPRDITPDTRSSTIKAQMLEASNAVLGSIRSAAIAELDGAVRVREVLENLRVNVLDRGFVEKVRKATARGDWTGKDKRIILPRMPEYIGALVQVYVEDNWAHRCSKTRNIAKLAEINKLILSMAKWSASPYKVFRARSFMTLQEMHACAIILQIKTMWNYSSVLEIRLEDIEFSSKGCVIRSLKTKVNEYTPEVSIDESSISVSAQHDDCEIASVDDPAYRVVKMLVWNHTQLNQAGRQSSADTRLFISAFSKISGRTYHSPNCHADFIRRYSLPKFSLDQIRTETLFLESLGGSIHTARRRAGHLSIRTTGRYVKHDINDRLHQSLNAGMQRQFEEEVHLLRSGEVKPHELKLLRPIGDGTSCADPSNPPWMKAGEEMICPATHCHIDGGCSNRRLVVTEESIRDMLRTEVVYSENWKVLYSQNPYEFQKFHAPAIAFNSALVRIVSESSHGYVIERIRRELKIERT